MAPRTAPTFNSSISGSPYHRSCLPQIRHGLKNAALRDRRAESPSYHHNQTLLVTTARSATSKRIFQADVHIGGQVNYQAEKKRLAWRRNLVLLAFIVTLIAAGSGSVQASEASLKPVNAYKGAIQLPCTIDQQGGARQSCRLISFHLARLPGLPSTSGCSPGPHHQAIRKCNICHTFWHCLLRDWLGHHTIPAR